MLQTERSIGEEEQKVYDFIQTVYPNLLDTYVRVIPRARFLVMERMINALLREDFVKKELVEEELTPSYRVKLFFQEGTLVVPIKLRYSYRRYQLEKNPTFINSVQQSSEVTHPSTILELIVKNDKYANLEGFKKELAGSVANMGLTLLFYETKREEIQVEASQFRLVSTLAYVESMVRKDPLFDPSLFFEQMCGSGHQLHPCTKAKIGLKTEEIIQYSAEFNNLIHLQFVAVHNELTYRNPRLALEQLMEFWQVEYPQVYQAIIKACEASDRNACDYTIVPLHPWQYKHSLPQFYSEELARGEIFPLDITLPAKPTLSVRTVMPLSGKQRHHLKLPMNIQITSAVRTISPNSIHNGPELSELLQLILKRENYYEGKIGIISEELGARFQATDTADPQLRDRNKNLSYLVRRNPTSLIGEGEYAIVACALFQPSPITEKILLCELVEGDHCRSLSYPLEENILSFTSRYTTTILSSLIPLMSKYGIGLEGHLQNTVMVWKDGEPVKVLIRDLGGVRVDTRRLTEQGIHGTFYPDSVTIGEDEVAMQNKVIHTVFQSHLGELTYHLAKEYGIEEGVLWREIRKVCISIFSELKKDTKIASQVERDIAALLESKTVQTKALTRMRLTDDVTDYAFIDVPNPLSESC